MYILRTVNTHFTLLTHCDPLQHIATHCNILQHTATHGNTLQHTETHGNTPQHTATHIATHAPVCCSVLQSGGNSYSYLSTNELLIPGL